MAEINTTINVSVDGKLYPLNKMIKEVTPVAAQKSVIDEIATPSGKGFYTGDILKMIKRPQVTSTAASARGQIGGFVGATSQELHSVFIGKTTREDNIVFNESDLLKLKEGKGGNIIALEAGNFIITGRELDAHDLLEKLKSEAKNVKLFTAVDSTTGLATGTQPTQSTFDFASCIGLVQNGKRVFSIDESELDAEIDNRIKLVRECVQYLNEIGTPENLEGDLYPYSINGFQTSSIKVLSTYRNNLKLKEKDTQRFVNISGPNSANITGIVGYIDNDIAILQTNQLGSDVFYAIMTNRVIARDLDPSQQYIGKVRDSAAVVMKDGTTKNLKPNERLMQFLQARTQGIRYAEEAFFILKHTTTTKK